VVYFHSFEDWQRVGDSQSAKSIDFLGFENCHLRKPNPSFIYLNYLNSLAEEALRSIKPLHSFPEFCLPLHAVNLSVYRLASCCSLIRQVEIESHALVFSFSFSDSVLIQFVHWTP